MAFGHKQQKLSFSTPGAKKIDQSRTVNVIEESSPGHDDTDLNTLMEVEELPPNPALSANESCESRRKECDVPNQTAENESKSDVSAGSSMLQPTHTK